MRYNGEQTLGPASTPTNSTERLQRSHETNTHGKTASSLSSQQMLWVPTMQKVNK